MPKGLCREMVLLLLLVAVLSLSPVRADEDTAVRVWPASGSYPVGSEIGVDVWVENVVGLYGADIQLTFDVTRLAVVDASPSLPGVQVTPRHELLSPDLIVRREADNEAGTIWYAVTQLNPREPATGSGPLFSFTFQTLGAGLAVVAVDAHQLADQNAEPIASKAEGAQYQLAGLIEVFLPLVLAGYAPP